MKQTPPTWIAPRTKRIRQDRNDLVQMDPAFFDVVDELLSTANKATVDAMKRRLGEVHDDAEREWPVSERPGPHSRDDLLLEWKARLEAMEVAVVNTAPYADEIRGGQTVEELLIQPGIKAADAIAQDIVDRIAREGM